MKKIAYLLLTISFCGLTACKTGTKKGGNMDNETLVKIETTLGDIKVKLYNETPKHRDNFIKLAEDGVYEGTLVTVAIHPTKVGLFTIEQRKELLKKATAHLKNVIVDSTDELFMDYVKKVNGQVLIRGLRSTTDFDYELQYAQSNQYLNSQIEIMYLMTKPSHSFISSSVVKEIASYHKPLTGLVPECVEDALKKVYQDQ